MRSLIYIDTQVNGQLTNEQIVIQKYEQSMAYESAKHNS